MRSFRIGGVLLVLLAGLGIGVLHGQSALVCPDNAMVSRLTLGEQARVVPGGVPNRVREAASLSAAQVGQLAPETVVDLTDGPACADGIIWWYVVAGDTRGWTAEGLPPSDYFLEPFSFRAEQLAGTRIAQATLEQQASATASVQQATQAAAMMLTSFALSDSMTATTQAQITPSATLTPSPTPTITPTLPPLMLLPTERALITPENARDLVPLAILPVGLFSVFFTPTGDQVLLNGELAYNLPDMTPSDTFGGYPVSLGRVLAISPDLRCVVFRPYQAGWVPLHLWDAQGEASSSRVLDFLPLGNSIALSAGPRYLLAVAHGEGYGSPVPPQVYIYDITNERMAQTLDNPAAFTAEVTFNRDASRVAATGNNLRLIEIDRAQWRIPVSGSAMGTIVYRPVPANAPEQVAYGGGRGVVLADLGRGTQREYEITGGTLAGYIAFSPDGALMLTYGVEIHGDFDAPPPRFNLFNVNTGDMLIDSGYYRPGFAFSPDGTLLVVGTADGLTHILGVR